MSGTDCAGLAPWDRSVWLLGNTHPSADKSVRWDDEPFPNLSDPDMLVVDLTTLTRPVLERIGKAKLKQAQPFIRDKIINHGTVVVITQPLLQIIPAPAMGKNLPHLPSASYQDDPLVYSNYEIFPARLATRDVPDGGIIVPDPGHAFKEYADNVRRFSFYIEDYFPRVILDEPENSSAKIELRPIPGQEIKDNSGHRLGLALTVAVVNYYYHTCLPRPGAGRLVFLPPPTEPIEVAIGRILSALGKSAPHAEASPAWAERLTLGCADEYLARAARLKEEDMARIQGEIDSLERQAGEILAHRRLLYATGRELEDAVVQAFRTLGFDDTVHMAGADEEDAAFGMGGGTPYSHGVIEAKGAGRGAQMQDINQCNRWTDQRAEGGGKPSKGILVANQHRLEPYPESLEARVYIEPNQEERAKMKDICIIPSCVLFEAVRRVLSGEAPDRDAIEARIAASRGVLKDVF